MAVRGEGNGLPPTLIANKVAELWKWLYHIGGAYLESPPLYCINDDGV